VRACRLQARGNAAAQAGRCARRCRAGAHARASHRPADGAAGAEGLVGRDREELIEGKPYYQLSFVENRKQNVHRRASFLVAKTGKDILVEDAETDTVQSLDEWRRNIRRVELK
jgi:hypothetical protein